MTFSKAGKMMRGIIFIALLPFVLISCSKTIKQNQNNGLARANHPKDALSKAKPSMQAPSVKPIITKKTKKLFAKKSPFVIVRRLVRKTKKYRSIQRPTSIGRAIIAAISLSCGQGIFSGQGQPHDRMAVIADRLSNTSIRVNFYRGTYSGDDSKNMKEKFCEVIFRRSDIKIKSFARYVAGDLSRQREFTAVNMRICRAIVAACVYSFERKLIKHKFQIDPEKEKKEGFYMIVHHSYPPQGGDYFHLLVSPEFHVIHYEEGT